MRRPFLLLLALLAVAAPVRAQDDETEWEPPEEAAAPEKDEGPPLELGEGPSSACTIEPSVETKVGGPITLHLKDMEWEDWQQQCDRLGRYLRPGDTPYLPETAGRAERLLKETGFFDRATCRLQGEGAALDCIVLPARMVYEVDIGGDIPAAVLKDDLRRRVFLRPGTVIEDEAETLARQRKRLEDYLRREGLFGSVVQVRAEPVEEARPNQGLLLKAKVAPGRKAMLRRVTILGDNPLPRKKVVKRLRHYWILWFFQERFRPLRFDEDLESVTELLQDEGWPEARVTGDWSLDLPDEAVDVTLEIDAGPRLELEFVGNARLSDRKLADLTTFREAGVVDVVEMEDTAETIRLRYQEEGFYAAKVKFTSEQPAEDVLKVRFEIEEGPRAKIEQVSFEGNAHYRDETLLDEAELRTDDGGFLRAGRWVEAWVEADAREIVDFYRLRGYGATEVRPERKILGPEALEAVFHVKEGPRRMVTSMTMENLPADVDRAALLDRLELVAGAPYVHAYLGQDRREILATLAGSGYPNAVVKRDLEKPDRRVGGPVTIHYRLQPGAKAEFGGVLVRGNFRTDRGLIENELRLDPGDDLDLIALAEARRRLRALGPFSTVELSPLDAWREEPETWLLVALQERDARALDAVVAASTDDGLSLGVDYRDRNLFGRAIRLDARARAGRIFGEITPALRIGDTDEADVTLRAPTPLGLPFDVDVSGFYRYEEQPELFRERRLGGGAGLTREVLQRETCPVCPDVTASLRYELTAGTFENLGEAAEGTTGLDRADVGRIAPVLVVDDRNSFVDPTSGYLADLRVELAHRVLSPIGQGATFWRILGSGQGYVNLGRPFGRRAREPGPFGGPVVLAGAVTYGASRPFGESTQIPASETFYYGGDYSVRGLDLRASAEGNPRGNDYLFIGNLEVRWYAFPNLGFGTLQVAAFADLGTVSNDFGSLFQQVTVSVGPVLRYVTPVGPISVGWGWPVVFPPTVLASPSGKFHLTFGYAF